MLNILIAGIGGQGSVLAAKILAQAALEKGWQVRTAETIGMAQRGGNVTSHVRMGDKGEPVYAPLIAKGTANCVIALEAGEGIRALPYLSPEGLMVCATTAIPSVMTNLAGEAYEAAPLIAGLQERAAHFRAIDAEAICAQVGSSKVANIVMLGAAVLDSQGTLFGLRDAIDMAQMRDALKKCVKPQFVELNLAAIEATAAQLAAQPE